MNNLKRLVGVNCATLEQMVSAAKKIAAKKPKKISGRKLGPKEKFSWYNKGGRCTTTP